jgi:hypothetical protein
MTNAAEAIAGVACAANAWSSKENMVVESKPKQRMRIRNERSKKRKLSGKFHKTTLLLLP